MAEDYTSTEIDELTKKVAEIYNVSETDISTDVDYTVTGRLDLDDIPEDVTQEEVEEAVISSIAEELGVHPKDVEIISIDMKTGEVIYAVKADDYETAETLQEKLENAITAKDLEENIQELIPEIKVDSNIVEEEIELDVTFVLDGSEVDSVKNGNEEFEREMKSEGFDSSTKVEIITSLPTQSPIIITDIPSAAPSVTGLIVSISLTKENEVLNTTQIEDLQNEIATQYNVDPESVTIDTTYKVTGTMNVEIPSEGVTEEELEQIEQVLEQTIADSLGLHPKNIEVTVDPETGEVTYVISVDDPTIAEETQEALNTEEFITNVNEGISENAENLPEGVVEVLEIKNVQVEEDIVMEVDVTIDASESTSDLSTAHEDMIGLLEDIGYDVTENIVVVTAKPSLNPVLAPTSSIPTMAPSITGLVATIDVSKSVTKSLSTSELEKYEEEIRNNFNITNDEEITTTVTYSTTGTMTVDIDPSSDLTPEEIENMVEESLANELGIHPQNIEVTYDPKTNELRRLYFLALVENLSYR